MSKNIMEELQKIMCKHYHEKKEAQKYKRKCKKLKEEIDKLEWLLYCEKESGLIKNLQIKDLMSSLGELEKELNQLKEVKSKRVAK